MLRSTAILGVLLMANTAWPQNQDFDGRVVGITDGDTVTVLTAARDQVRVRLAEIDAPERGQPYSNRSRQALSNLVFQKDVLVRYQDTDRYGRVVGRIFVGDLDISAAMVRSGAAWAYRDYVRDRNLLELEAEARANRRGLWGLSEFERIEPWEWRQGQRPDAASRARPVPSAPRDSAFTCGTKQYCREFSSCAEAMFYLNECGLDTIDGDNDGVPCEASCP
jgi:endonuclease YncB( thermonuclease family)